MSSLQKIHAAALLLKFIRMLLQVMLHHSGIIAASFTQAHHQGRCDCHPYVSHGSGMIHRS